MTVTPNPEFTKKIIDEGAETLNLCFQCGTCTGSCPSGRHTAFRVRKLFRLAQLGLKDRILPTEELWACTTCYTCYERCPRGVDTVGIVFALRNLAVKEGHMAEAHKKTAGYLIKFGHLVPLSKEFRAKRTEIGLDEVPPTVTKDKKAIEDVKTLFKSTEFDKLIGYKEVKK
jgi:heterodisulfide reductase subunit C